MRRELSTGPGARRLAAFAVAVTAVAGLLALAPDPARADAGLVSADPPAGAVLDAAPTEVTMTFDDSVDEELSHVAVLDTGRKLVARSEPARSGAARLRLPLRIEAAGDYTVAYHVTFADGTTTTGAYRFSVGTGLPPAPLDDAARQASRDAVAKHVHRIDGFSAFLLVVDGAVLAVVLALLWLRPRGRPSLSLRADPRF